MNEEAKRAKFGEGEEAFKKAKKKCAASFTSFRFKPDWERAGPLFEKAALCYKQSGVFEKAVEAFEMAATANDRMGSPWHAAKHMETCAELCKLLKQDKWLEMVPTFYRRAGAYYVEAGKPATGGDCLSKGARAIEASEPATAVSMYNEAICMYEADGREAQASDVYRAAIGATIKQGLWMEAATLLMKFGAACDKTAARSSQFKAYLGAVVVWYAAGDAKAAHNYFQDAMDVPGFECSEEALAADALFFAYKTGSAETIKKVVSARPAFKQLDNQVARLALRLPVGELAKQARVTAGLLGGDSDPGSEEPDEEEEVL